MTIHDLRKIICVLGFAHDNEGGLFNYSFHKQRRSFHMDIDVLADELIAISSIEDKQELIDGYNISQWDALNLVIRHEYAKYLEAEIEGSDIGKAINNLK